MAKTDRKVYKRDGRAPIPEREIISKIMSSIRGKNTKPELTLRKALWKNRLGGYRVHWKKVAGCPDICYPGRKIAIFVNGCFWHKCPHCKLQIPKAHNEYWKRKLLRNVQRDKRKEKELRDMGWKVIIFWECEIKKDLSKILKKIAKAHEKVQK